MFCQQFLQKHGTNPNLFASVIFIDDPSSQETES
jgi:hypothetical protein